MRFNREGLCRLENFLMTGRWCLSRRGGAGGNEAGRWQATALRERRVNRSKEAMGGWAGRRPRAGT